jgi:glycosyltransferase involved in cell wall biosynthesis
MNSLAPIVLFVYNRPDHARKTVESLLKNRLSADSDLYIFSDGGKTEADIEKVDQVRKYIESIKGFRNVIVEFRQQNLGLANSVISGVTQVINKHHSVIVMEDDILSSANFLEYSNAALQFYRNDSRIFSVSGYTAPISIPENYPHDIYISNRCSSLGWATWKDRWEKADWNVSDFPAFCASESMQREFNQGGDDLTAMLKKQQAKKNNSWAVRWCYAHYKNKAYCVYPVVSKIKNIGSDNTGTHDRRIHKVNTVLDDDSKKIEMVNNITIYPEVMKQVRSFYRLSIFRKFLNRFIYRF